MAPSTDDSGWEVMQLPAEWERASEELADFDGTVWFRRTVEVPSTGAGVGTWCWISGASMTRTRPTSTAA